MRLVRLSNLLNINAKPFDSATFEPAAEIVYTDARGKPRVILPDYNCIRFRNVTNPDGTTTVKSNARWASISRCHPSSKQVFVPSGSSSTWLNMFLQGQSACMEV